MNEKQVVINNNAKGSMLFTRQVLKGLGQIMLQENLWTGLLFLLGITYGSPIMGIAALLATCCGTIIARILKFDNAELNKGIYGFSAALTGVACMLFFKPTLIIWLFVVIGSSVATILQYYFIKLRLPVFTLPFVLVTWLFLFIMGNYFPNFLFIPEVLEVTHQNQFDFAIKGYGQVIFQGKLLSGILFFVAVFICSPIAALYGLAGGVLSGILSQYLEVPVESISNGLFSFNAVLCAITFAGERVKDGLWVLVSILISLVVSFTFVQLELPQLTFPFVAASFLVVFMKQSLTAQKLKNS